MSHGPVAGNGIPITLAPGKVVFWSALVQATNTQFVQIKDSAGAVVFTAAGASPDGHSPAQIGAGFFQPADPTGAYTVWLGTNGGASWSSVVWSQDVLDDGGPPLLTKYVFGSEDGGDADYNDTYLQLQWFDSVG
ncbi:hypothetical protein [Brevundimonas sp.]|jgi:hypothetical protein|uniref:hypothetical protein n=1 Tax=Brevundimonas sp. TaxID=1871086 RepID=UPI0037C05911